MIFRVGEGDCDNKGVSDGETWRESDGEDSYSEEEGDGEISIPATVIITIIINAFILSCMYNIKPVDESMTQWRYIAAVCGYWLGKMVSDWNSSSDSLFYDYFDTHTHNYRLP